MGLYQTVMFWRTMQFADKLAVIKTSGVSREVVLRDGDDVSSVLSSLSSAFKCYDIYRVLSGDRAAAQSVLNTFGVANESIRFGFETDQTL